MVMHARKTQRMNDGYFEKHQAHPYQNSKYGSSKAYGSTSDRYDRIRDSPNGNYRSDSPDSQSPRDRERSYQSKSSYLQKIREKERENRDYKMSRDVKYSDCARSPKDKRIRESEHRTNNDRNDEKGILHPIKVSQNLTSRDRKTVHNNSVDKRDERERVVRVGDWSEHVSSSGKKYYYNCKTEVSQWEKPREWIERERDRFRNRERDRDRDAERCYSRSGHDKHSNLRPPTGMSSKDINRETIGNRHWNSSSSSSRIDDNDIPMKDIPSRSRKPHQQSQQQHYQDGENSQLIQQDMDISPGDSTPTSEISFTTTNSNQINNSNIDHSNNINTLTTTLTTSSATTTVGPVLLANALPRLISHPVSSATTSCSSSISSSHQQQQQPTTPSGRSDTSPQSTLSLLAGLQPTTSTSTITSNTPGPPLPPPIGSGNSSNCLNRISSDNVQQRQTLIGDSAVHTSLSVDINHTGTVVEGPPTPTHSETPDCSKENLKFVLVTVPVSSPPSSGNLSTLQGMSSSLQALRPQGPTITPSLANHYRDDLVNHVRGWPAEILEKQAQKLAEEAYIMSSIQCSKVSAELKSARSIVRLTEIQATLQEQRILFLRQQIKELEELKSQNSFMSDDS